MRTGDYIGGVVSKGLLVAHHVKRDGITADGEIAGGKWLHAGVEVMNFCMPVDSASDGPNEIEASKSG